MGASSISLYLIRIIVLAGLAAGFLLFGRRRGARGRATVAIIFGFLCLVGGEAAGLLNQWKHGALPDAIAGWQNVYIYVLGYLSVGLGVLFWVRDLNASRSQLEADNWNLRQLAEIDFLTELVNRRHATGYIKREIARARRQGTPVGFVMMDLDHFKAVNDTHGHQAGDAVLAHVGRLLKERLRASDILVRYGGEEFLLVLPDSGPESSAAIAETLRRTFEATTVRTGKQDLQIRASFGVACVGPGQNVTVDEIIARADEALYAAKGLGRNRVTTWAELTPAQDRPQAAAAQANAASAAPCAEPPAGTAQPAEAPQPTAATHA